MRISRPCALAIVAVVGIGGSAGCNSKTEKQVYAEAKPVADALRAKVVAAAALIDKRPAVPAGSSCKAPKKLTFDPKSDAHDTDYMMLQEAKRGGGKEDDRNKNENLDLHFATNPFPRLLRGTSPNSIYSPYSLDDRARPEMMDAIRRGANVKNLVIVREKLAVFDYFLVDLAAASPTIVCAGTFTATSDASLGEAHTEEWVTITKNKRTGKEVKRETKSVTSDPARDAQYKDAETQLALHMQKELGLSGIE